MKIFKLSKDDPNTHTITNESDFLKLTGKKLPWVRTKENKSIYYVAVFVTSREYCIKVTPALFFDGV